VTSKADDRLRSAEQARLDDAHGLDGLLMPRIVAALTRLAEARRYAEDTRRDVWDFAVEIASLELWPNDLRWLVCRGYAEHALEQPRQDGSARCFERDAGLTLGEASCFVLTEAGLALARSLPGGADDTAVSAQRATGPGSPTLAAPPMPRWDPDRRELWLGDKLVKRFRQAFRA
jgi:hypothetical protein